MWRIRYIWNILKEERGIGVVEIILIFYGCSDRSSDYI